MKMKLGCQAVVLVLTIPNMRCLLSYIDIGTSSAGLVLVRPLLSR